MNRLDRLIGYFSPSKALQRQQARAGIEAYKAAESNRLTSVMRDGRDPNSPVYQGAVSLRERARTLEQDNDIARHALDILVNKTIGTGLKPEPMVLMPDGKPFQSINDRLSDLYEQWAEYPEASHTHDAVSAQRLMARTFFRDGEVLFQHIEGNVRGYRHTAGIPYAFEMIEPDLLPMDYTGTERPIVQGIEVNAWRQPLAYMILADYYNSQNMILRPSQYQNVTIRVPAERMEHLALRDRIAQLRGVSAFASTIIRFGDIGEIEESERVAARVAAAMCAVIVKGNADDWSPTDVNGERLLKWKPGMIFDDLMPGERVESMTSNRPNNQVIEFRDANMRAAAGGLGIGYSNLSNDYNGSYSSQRQELVEQEVGYDVLSEFFIKRMELPKYRRFVRMAIAAGLVPEWRQADADTLEKAWYAAPAMPWVDPQKEMNALETAINLGLTSRSMAQRERGLTPRDVLKERYQDAVAERELMSEFEAVPAPPPSAPDQTPDDETDDDDDNGGVQAIRIGRRG